MESVCKCGHYIGMHNTKGCNTFDPNEGLCPCEEYDERGKENEKV